MTIRKYFFRIVYDVILSKLPDSMHPGGKIYKGLRAYAVKNFISYCGKNVNIENHAIISSKLSIDDNSGIGIYARIGGTTYIGKNVSMGPECVIITRNHSFERKDIPIREQGYEEEKPVFIGDDVWIGYRVIILPGAHIGKGVIVGAGAVVSGKIPDYTIIGGVPAKVIKYR